MRFKMKRIASTLLFGLFCSVITALHFSAKQLPDGGPPARQRFDEIPVRIRFRDGNDAVDSPKLPVDTSQDKLLQQQKTSLGVRLQREMAWAVDDSSQSVDSNLQQQKQQQRLPKVPKKVDFVSEDLVKNTAPVIQPLNPKAGNAFQNRTTDQNMIKVIPKIVPKVNKLNNFSNDSVRGDFEQTELADIFIGVKTTGPYHKNRLQLIIDTWLPLAQKQTYFFTDQDDSMYQQALGDHLINTKCPSMHSRQALCCKLATMYDTFLQSGKRWFCHLDDDNYLNVRNLVQLLQRYNHEKDYYLGRASLSHPIQALDRDMGYKQVSFWFATGGAGFCISKSLALKMAPLASGGQFTNLCSRVRLPDDVSVGFVVDGLLKIPLIKLNVFNSHLQGLGRLEESQLRNQVTLSYYISEVRRNTITLKNGAFSQEEDPTRLKSLHCSLYPGTSKCS